MNRVALPLFVLAAACSQTTTTPSLPTQYACAHVGYPAREWQSPESISQPVRTLCLGSGETTALGPIADEARLFGFDVRAAGPCDLTVVTAIGAFPSDVVAPNRPGHEDGFASIVERGDAGLRVTLYAETARGAHDGLHDLLQQLRVGSALPVAAADAPGFGIRGVIEGFYNRYFSPAERAATLGLMHQLRLNTYLYAPKDDPYAGYQWRAPYPASNASDIAAAAFQAQQLGIDFVYGISPTLATNRSGMADPATSIRFSSTEDVDALVDKLEGLKALGISRFAILFDDGNSELFHPEDRAAFASAAEAHASLANELLRRLGTPLYFVGYYYSAVFDGWQDYNATLGRLLDGSIDVFWTGASVFPPSIAVTDLSEVDQLLGRKVLLWDNAPISLGPLTGRAPDLPGAAIGYLSNATLVGDLGHPIQDYWASLGTIADYAWSPAAYAPATSYAAWQQELSAMLTCSGD